MSKSALKRRAREAREWLMDACFPLWAERGVGPHGLFQEQLGMDHQPAPTDTTRLRVQARQTYVFAEALRMGWKPETARDLVAMGIATMTGPGLRPDGLPGRTLNMADASLADATPDLYDTAFVLFALAEADRALGGDPDARAAVQGILGQLDLAMGSPDGGYLETVPPGPQRHQNPHMHLLEACLSLHQADPDAGHLGRARDLLNLFETKLIAGEGGLIGEHFGPGWAKPAGRDADIVEPGHQFEWVWLLHALARLSGEPVSPAARPLYEFACATLDPEGRAVQEVTRAGIIADGSRRTWPQTEALKAHLTLFETTGEESYAAAACRSFDVLMDEYLTPEGGWIEHYDAEGKPMSHIMPASTGYHVVLAFSFLMRVMKD